MGFIGLFPYLIFKKLISFMLIKPRLELELIPVTAYGQNARQGIWKKDWGKIREIICQTVKYFCQICRRKQKTYLQCNEVWEFDPITTIQKLIRLEAICWICHETKHWKHFYSRRESPEETLQKRKLHLCKVNGWTEQEADTYIQEKLTNDQLNSQVTNWKLVIGSLSDYLPKNWNQNEMIKAKEFNERILIL